MGLRSLNCIHHIHKESSRDFVALRHGIITMIAKLTRLTKDIKQIGREQFAYAKCTHNPIVKSASAIVAAACIVKTERATPAAGR
jgi:hypothetical protein